MKSITIPVEGEISLGSRFYLAGESAANILFFHGNGEIAADYDDIGTLYRNMGMNFIVIDYRGYGISTGQPTVTAMMRDCHVVFAFIKKWLAENAYDGPFVVMGRSLGSASTLELAYHYKERIDGLIIESGFAHVNPLLQLLGTNFKSMGGTKEADLNNVDKISQFDKPTLIIHAEYDHIIPYNQGEILYENCPSRIKRMLKIEGANHNNIFAYGIESYMDSVKWLIGRLKKTASERS
jgi:pimeloyl-ACP methyl ester carboxylesterase